MSLTENYQNIKLKIPDHIELVAVSKTHPAEMIAELYEIGQRVFGENKVQELTEKYEKLPKDIHWHLIGHLQSNKVKYIAPFVNTIQSVDSEKILDEINKQAEKNDRKINVLLQVKIAQEDSKFGLEISEAEDLIRKKMAGEFANVNIKGLMGMATFTENQEQIAGEFNILKSLYDKINNYFPLEKLSMGMSDDFLLAIKSGSNSVRVGSAIFGARDYR
ncbi:alanine racemase [Chryseobacterium sp. Leaf180]|uniref:YggS family pyridoxal phosphate-dependent enzyme n=1 Tax=Chryseobacterium sp. Leaf180 TaxID=1736289 RepID=UPI0006F97ECF|nr:YggS family pyridoxal phosphate-dependent enzyme [Chryseobacterium sp. Leaf180]KQR94724.1 alanine racemase [Chryseobacterium sp. Leaf180]